MVALTCWRRVGVSAVMGVVLTPFVITLAVAIYAATAHLLNGLGEFVTLALWLGPSLFARAVPFAAVAAACVGVAALEASPIRLLVAVIVSASAGALFGSLVGANSPHVSHTLSIFSGCIAFSVVAIAAAVLLHFRQPAA
jgi:hypothetical protein